MQAERIAEALELIAARLRDPDHDLLTRVATLEDLLKDFVGIIRDPHSSNEEWQQLLLDTMEALGLDAPVAST